MLSNLVSLVGLASLILLAWLFSADRRRFQGRLLGWSLGLMFVFSAIIFWLPPGRAFFSWVNSLVFSLLGFSREGVFFVFGSLSLSPGQPGSLGFFLAFQVLPSVIFFSAVVSLLYFLGVMQWLIHAFSWLFTRTLQTSGAESLCVASNIFVGVESSVTIRPYLARMTQSELLAILTGGMATIASTVLGLYSMFLEKSFPGIAGHLVSASILSAPAALLMAKLLLPETETPETFGLVVSGSDDRAGHWMEALIKGSMDGVRLAVGIAALLVALLGLLAMINAALTSGGSVVGLKNLRLEGLLAYLFYPLTLAMGVPTADAWPIAQLLGLRVIATEVPAYQQLAVMMQQGTLSEPRSAIIAVYALCGFAHIPSVAIFVGGLAAIEPKRTRDLGALGLRALFAATLACLMTGALAGLFFVGQDTILLGKPKPAVLQKAAPSSQPPSKARATTLPASR